MCERISLSKRRKQWALSTDAGASSSRSGARDQVPVRSRLNRIRWFADIWPEMLLRVAAGGSD